MFFLFPFCFLPRWLWFYCFLCTILSPQTFSRLCACIAWMIVFKCEIPSYSTSVLCFYVRAHHPASKHICNSLKPRASCLLASTPWKKRQHHQDSTHTHTKLGELQNCAIPLRFNLTGIKEPSKTILVLRCPWTPSCVLVQPLVVSICTAVQLHSHRQESFCKTTHFHLQAGLNKSTLGVYVIYVLQTVCTLF